MMQGIDPIEGAVALALGQSEVPAALAQAALAALAPHLGADALCIEHNGLPAWTWGEPAGPPAGSALVPGLGALSWWRAAGDLDPALRQRLEAPLRRVGLAVGGALRALTQAGEEASILEAIPDAVVGVDRAGLITLWSRGAQAMLGYPAEDVLGRSAHVFIPTRFHSAHDEGMARAAAGQASRAAGQPMELVARHRDGHELQVEVHFNLVARPGRAHVIGVLRDITGRVAAQEESLRQAAEVSRHTTALMALGRERGHDLDAFLRRVDEVVAQALGVERVSLWRLEGDRIHCQDQFTRGDGAHTAGDTMSAADQPAWFEAMAVEEVIDAPEARTHPATAGLTASHYARHGIWSVMEVPLRSLMGLRGVLSVESTTPRQWRPAELQFCLEVASLVVQALDRANFASLEAWYSTVLSSIGDAVVACDTQGRVSLLNPVAEALFGWSSDEAVGRPLEDVVVSVQAGDRCPLLERLEATLGGDSAGEVQGGLLVKGRDGTLRPLVERMSPIVRNGRARGVVITFRDLTEEEAHRRELARQNEQLRAISEAIPDMLFAMRLDGQLRLLQRGATIDLLVMPEEVPRHTAYTIFAPELARRVVAAAAVAVETAVVQTVEYRLERLWGTNDYEARMARLSDDEVVILVRNVTVERARAEALREQQERTGYLLSLASAIIYSASLPDFRVDYVSESAQEVLGFTVAEYMAPDFWVSKVHPEDLPRVMAAMPRLLAVGRNVNEYRHRHADGSYRWLRDEVRIVHDAQGKGVRAIGSSFDITDRKRGEQRLDLALQINQIVSRFSADVLGGRGRSVLESVSAALGELGPRVEARRILVLRVMRPDMVVAAQWSADPAHVLLGPSCRVPLHQMADLRAVLAEGKPRYIADLSDLRPSPGLDALAAHDVKHVILAPMMVQGDMKGVIAVEDPNTELLNPEQLCALVQVVADALAAGLQQADDEQVRLDLNARLTRQAELQRALVNLSAALARSDDADELLLAVEAHLRAVVGEGLVTFLTLDVGPGRYRIRTFFQSGAEAEEPAASEGELSHLVGSALVRAMETRAPVSTQDHAIADFWDWELFYGRDGRDQFLVIPLVSAGEVIGTLNMATREDLPPSTERVDWASQLGSMVASHLAIQEARDALRRLNAELEDRVVARTVALQASEARLERLFQHAPQAMLMVDADQRIARSNLRARRLFGYSEADFGGLSLSALVPPELRELHATRLQELGLLEGASRMSERRIVGAVRADGSLFSAEVGLVPLEVNGETLVLAGVTDVSDRLAAEEEVRRSLREKETLLKEIHHRVKNNLQIISSLLMLQSDQSASPELRALLSESVFRVRSMALIHQMLYGVESLERVDFAEYTRILAESLRSTLAPSARIALETATVELNVERAVPLGLILNELLTNAFKYGRPLDTAGQGPWDLKVTLQGNEEELFLEVRDQGPGLPAGFDLQRSSTLGMQLVRSLGRQLRARLTVNNEDGAVFGLRCSRKVR